MSGSATKGIMNSTTLTQSSAVTARKPTSTRRKKTKQDLPFDPTKTNESTSSVLSSFVSPDSTKEASQKVRRKTFIKLTPEIVKCFKRSAHKNNIDVGEQFRQESILRRLPIEDRVRIRKIVVKERNSKPRSQFTELNSDDEFASLPQSVH